MMTIVVASEMYFHASCFILFTRSVHEFQRYFANEHEKCRRRPFSAPSACRRRVPAETRLSSLRAGTSTAGAASLRGRTAEGDASCRAPCATVASTSTRTSSRFLVLAPHPTPRRSILAKHRRLPRLLPPLLPLLLLRHLRRIDTLTRRRLRGRTEMRRPRLRPPASATVCSRRAGSDFSRSCSSSGAATAAASSTVYYRL
jgi:hypothetical protein